MGGPGRRSTWRGLLAGLAAISGVVVPAPSAGAGTEFPPAVESRLEDLTQLLGEVHTPGALVAVSVPGQGRFLGVEGVAGIGDPAPLDPAMHFRIGSITKTFTATAVLELVDQCLLGLDDTIERWQPRIRDAHAITIRQLLGMRSGIPDLQSTAEFNDVFNADPFFEWDEQQLVDLVAHQDLLFTPGTQWAYSNTNYYILGLIVESITGQPLEQVIDQRILQPLGLHDTSFPTTPDIPAPAAPGGIVVIDENGNLVSETPFNFSPSAVWAAGAMISTIADLEVWAQALATGSLLTPGLQAERLQFESTVGPETPQGETFPDFAAFPGPTLPVEYGLGMFAAGGYLGHNGAVSSHEAVMVFDPNTGTLIIELQNASVSFETMQHDKIIDIDAELPNRIPSSVAGILGQNPPLPPDPANAGVPHCAPAPAAPVTVMPRFTG